jgi:hypothetical protein
MRKSRFTESQIVAVLKQVGNGMPVDEVLRKAGVHGSSRRSLLPHRSESKQVERPVVGHLGLGTQTITPR